jgi:Flp pilus assembly pilin Flp
MYAHVFNVLLPLHRNDDGQGLVEYVLIMAVVTLGAAAGMNSVATVANSAFTTMGTIVGQYMS